MGILTDFLLKLVPRNRNKLLRLHFDDRHIHFVRHGGEVDSLDWDELERVLIRITDEGPFVEDVFFVLVGKEQEYIVTQAFDGTELLLERLQQLPGFDNDAVIDAMCCAYNNEFVCWERQGSA